MLRTLTCFVAGDKNTFSIKIDDTEMVEQLKDEIKKENSSELVERYGNVTLETVEVFANAGYCQ